MTTFLWTILLVAQSQVFRGTLDLATWPKPDVDLQVSVAKVEIRPTEGTVLSVQQTPARDPEDSLLIYVESTDWGVRVSVRARRPKRSLGDWYRVFKHLPDSVQQVVILLPRGVTYGNATLDLGVAEGTVDLGGLAFQTLEFNLGVGELVLDFSEPAPQEGEDLEINVGVGDFTARRLGNGRFRFAQVNTGVAAATIDLSGPWPPRARMDASAGVADVCFHIPEDLGVRVETQGFLVVRDFDPLVPRNGTWVTPNYETAPHHLLLTLGGAFTHYEVTYGEEECDD